MSIPPLDYSCRCGSGKVAVWIGDARGIPVVHACADCRDERMSKYRPEIFTDANYWADEPICE